MSDPLNEAKDALFGRILESKGHERKHVSQGERQCPQCGKVFTPDLPPNQGTAEQREQHMTGLCSNACWDAFLGPPHSQR